jgi:hypothetical protein
MGISPFSAFCKSASDPIPEHEYAAESVVDHVHPPILGILIIAILA